MSDSLLTRILTDLNAVPVEERLSYIQGQIAEIADPERRELVEAGLLLGMQIGPPQPREHVVVLVHGIRTYAEWQERLAAGLGDMGCETVYPVGYGFFDVISFLCPIATRRRPIERVLRELRTIRAKHRDADISVVAHSFGTYVLSKILEDATDLSLHRVVLCGSIIPMKFRWDKVISRVKGVVINEVGTRDFWPVAASKATWGYGPSGTFGFKTAVVKDRFHDCGHSDFFNDNVMNNFWIPLLVDGQIVASNWSRTRSRAHAGLSFLSWLPTKSIVFSGIVIFGGLVAFHYFR